MSMRRKLFIGSGCVAAFILVVIAIILYMANNITATVYHQLKAVRAGNIIQAYSFTSQDFRSATSLKEFEAFVNHYPSLKNNKSITIVRKEIKNDTGIIRGTLHSTDGSSISIEYLLIKEDGEWKILGIQANPVEAAVENTQTSASAHSLALSHSDALSSVYDNQDSRYSMKYPSNWEYEKAGDGTVIFSGKRGSPAFFSTVNIQTVLTKKTGGDFSTVKQFMADIKQQATSQSPGVKFLDNGAFTITEKNGSKDQGEFAIFTYTYKGKEFKQWQVVVLRNDGQVFYAWAYTSPLQQYPDNLKIAKAMLDSWVIY